MGRDELIACFQDTYQASYSTSLQNYTYASINSNTVYPENFQSSIPYKSEYGQISVFQGTTFQIASQYRTWGKVAVLNFANPENPGGGVRNGAMAQEECLCRSSNLYACISNENTFQEYYNYHRMYPNNYLYSDRLIYTKDVIVFKNDDRIPQNLPQEKWFSVDVITSAAPYMANNQTLSIPDLLELFKKRIKNIFEVARENQVEILILGAFGCGAFKNPPEVVAEAFQQVIVERNYLREFKHIVFAIKPTGEDCPNVKAFAGKFGKNNYIMQQNEHGISLSHLVQKNGPQSINTVIEWTKSICYLLEYFSCLNPPLIYGSLCPHDIFLTSDNQIKFVEFGFRKNIINGFSAPEEYTSEEDLTRQSFIYRLGSIMYFLLTGIDLGRPPYMANPIRRYNPDVPFKFEHIIVKCMATKPSKRYQTYEDLIRDLNKAQKSIAE